MKKDKDEKLQSLRGKAMKAFRKIALPVLAMAALSGGLVTEANAQNTHSTYGSVVTTQQGVQQQKPWANDPVYLEKIRLQKEKEMLRLQQEKARTESNIASYNASMARTRSYNVSQLQSLRKRGASALELMAHSQRMAADEAAHKARVNGAKNYYDQAVLRSEETMRNYVESLDRTYARQSPYKEILEQQQRQQAQRVATATQRVEAENNRPRSEAEQQAAIRAAQEKYQQEQLRKFQDAQIKAASEGKPLPKREDFGLPPEQPQKQRVSTASLDR